MFIHVFFSSLGLEPMTLCSLQHFFQRSGSARAAFPSTEMWLLPWRRSSLPPSLPLFCVGRSVSRSAWAGCTHAHGQIFTHVCVCGGCAPCYFQFPFRGPNLVQNQTRGKHKVDAVRKIEAAATTKGGSELQLLFQFESFPSSCRQQAWDVTIT